MRSGPDQPPSLWSSREIDECFGRWIRKGECGRNEENNYLVLMIGSLGGQGVPTICPFLSDRDKDKSEHFIHIFIY